MSESQTATFAGGCFWCTEAVFKRVKGVISVMPGYAGGSRPNPNWQQVITGVTGHAESLQIEFDPSIISYEKLVDIFFHTHNPTTLNQQDYDKGAEYRSVIFWHNEEQKKTAEKIKKELEESHAFNDPIVTDIIQFTNFYPAEEFHRNFYESGNRPDYCRIIIDPKIQKLLKGYGSDVKEEYKNG